MKEKIAHILNNKIAHLIARFILGSVFIYASMDKIAFPNEFTKIVINYHILPNKLAIYFAFILPWIELILGTFLILGFYFRESALLLSFIIVVFIVAIFIKSLKGPIDNCGCFRILSDNIQSNTFVLIIRDVLYLALALYIAFFKKRDIMELKY